MALSILLSLGGLYYLAAGNFSQADKGRDPLSHASLKRHTAEGLAFVNKGVTAKG
jgi:hypothetical protein